jgi:cellulose synthase/poly-beta-1,6-N-acetylglucosamine synthase-like glycosyltransferase
MSNRQRYKGLSGLYYPGLAQTNADMGWSQLLRVEELICKREISMLVLHVLRWLLLAIEIVIAGPVLYLCLLSISAILTAQKRKNERANPSSPILSYTNFAILIPAYNEEAILGTLLGSLSVLEYPKDRFTVYVVADNCTDDTAELTRKSGRVQIYERFDPVKRGKGYALNWLLQKLEEDQLIHEAYVILDADSVVEPAFLQVMNRELLQGAQALQAYYTVLNGTESPSTALRWIALTLVNYVRPLGRSGLGASSTLGGNGMCFSRALLLRHPWQAFSLAEDYQYYLTLVQHGEKIYFVPEAIVRSQMPTTFEQMRTQDIRWESLVGGQSTWRIAFKLLRAGLRFRDFRRIEAIAELLTPPLSLLVSCCLTTLIGSLLLWSWSGLVFSLILIGGLIGYIGTALHLLRPPRTVYIALLHSPGFIIWKLWVCFVLRRSKKYTSEWVRTSRNVS